MRTSDDCWLAGGVREVFATRGPRRHFFGYYDKSPLDANGRRLLCHAVDFDGRMVEAGDRAEVGYWDLETREYHRLGETRAFNWQLGSMLQWVGPDFARRVVYNARREHSGRARFGAVIRDLESGRDRELPHTVYSLDPKGRYALTPSFERHAFCRPGYCYAGVRDDRFAGDRPEGDGIARLDLETGEGRRIVTVSELIDLRPLPSMDAGAHYVEHLLVNPDGSRVAFFHRWQLRDGGIYTRCYTCDPEGGDLFALPDSGRYSHGCWLDARRFVITGRRAGTFSKIRYSSGAVAALTAPALRLFRQVAHRAAARWLHRQVASDAFLCFADLQGLDRVLGERVLVEDGHPGVRPQAADWLLIDSYPDAACRQHLMAYHLESGRWRQLAWFSTPEEHAATGYRCDLHSRWSRDGRSVVVDSLHSGSRQIHVLDVQEALDE